MSYHSIRNSLGHLLKVELALPPGLWAGSVAGARVVMDPNHGDYIANRAAYRSAVQVVSDCTAALRSHKNDALAMKLITESLAGPALELVSTTTSAHAMYVKLSAHYAAICITMKQLYKDQVAACTMAPTEHPELFIARWEKQVGYYIACGGVLAPREQLEEFVQPLRLPVAYEKERDALKDLLLLYDTTPLTYDVVRERLGTRYTRLLSDGALVTAASSAAGFGMSVAPSGLLPGRAPVAAHANDLCHHCGAKGHSKFHCAAYMATPEGRTRTANRGGDPVLREPPALPLVLHPLLRRPWWLPRLRPVLFVPSLMMSASVRI